MDREEQSKPADVDLESQYAKAESTTPTGKTGVEDLRRHRRRIGSEASNRPLEPEAEKPAS